MSTDVQRGSKLYKMREEGYFKETSNRENLEEQIELLKKSRCSGKCPLLIRPHSKSCKSNISHEK
ncbi:hypothetical protein ANHYDRO_00426 [Anaerococcus hydrogenalis DSM 7454]|uniref:Uncharacterized protein n=1 Tax=Anaerococcus hydrogenalis DSM 7454 TaxID=561177 RepID=B6W780_9FIRM|nr:hypothetical protein ANHYDRO_00426 [Anaerococcus hydrogenalis DSM 7454]